MGEGEASNEEPLSYLRRASGLGRPDWWRDVARTGFDAVWQGARPTALDLVLGRGVGGASRLGSWRGSPIGGAVGSEAFMAQVRSVMPRVVLPGLVPGDLWRRVTGLPELSDWLRSLIPANLHGLEMEEVARLGDISTEQRVAVLWVPRADVLRLLLDAVDAEARAAVLDEQVAVIVRDCRVLLGETTHPGLAELVEFAADAVAAHEAGRTRAAQALATNVLDTVLTQFTKSKRAGALVRQVRERHGEPLSPEASLRAVRIRLALAGVPSAYEQYRFEDRGAAFSRHGTAHAVNGAQYTPGNSMRALTLASSLLHFLDEGQREADHRARRDEEPPSSAV